MTAPIFFALHFRMRRLRKLLPGVVFAFLLVWGSILPAYGLPPQSGTGSAAPLTVSEFSRMIGEFSEPGGYFHADNFTSNESAYLNVVGKLKELEVIGGAYLGVGPEQNFTYIAKIRPRIAFLVDIRHQAILQHLLYKAIFHQARNRAQFLSLLFSKPVPGSSFETEASLERLLDYIQEAPTSREAFFLNLATIEKIIQEDFRFPLSAVDLESLSYIYSAFWQGNLRIGFRFGSGNSSYSSRGFPTLKDLILATDVTGRRGNFLAREEDYQFVRNLQIENRVIPVVGDFAGPKAIASVASYLKNNGYTVSAFYTSNVEQYLYADDVFHHFAANVRKLPISERSVFIRATRGGGLGHPARLPGHRMTTLLQKMSVFLKDYQAGLYPDYWSLVTTNYLTDVPIRRNVSPAPVP